MTPPRWIIIPNWGKFQHYGLARRPIWVKNYIELLHKDEYRDLTLAARGLLHGVWLAYAESYGQLRDVDLNKICATSARDKTLAALNHAGFIEFSARRPLPLYRTNTASPEKDGDIVTALTAYVRRHINDYPDRDVLRDELTDRGLTLEQASAIIETAAAPGTGERVT